MGGHGGLNIIPQKSWNVYGRRQRLKVVQDEEKEAKKQKEARERHENAEQEFRRQQLLKDASLERDFADAPPPGGVGAQQASTTAKHINFWEQDERGMRNAEVERQKRVEQAKRGNPETQTSDARFDQQFQFANSVGKVQPWYAKAPNRHRREIDVGPSHPGGNAVGESIRRSAIEHGASHASALARFSESAVSEDSSGSDRSDREERRGKRKRKQKERRSSADKESKRRKASKSSSGVKRVKRKHKRKHDDKAPEGVARGGVVKTVSDLRDERMRREARERMRTKQMLLGVYK